MTISVPIYPLLTQKRGRYLASSTETQVCTDVRTLPQQPSHNVSVATIKWKYCDVILHHIELFVPLFAHINSFNASVFDVHTAILLIWNLAFKDPYSVVRFTGDRLWPALGHLLLDVDPRHITTSCVEAYQHMLLQLWDCTRGNHSIETSTPYQLHSLQMESRDSLGRYASTFFGWIGREFHVRYTLLG